jgi:hypothetical protein
VKVQDPQSVIVAFENQVDEYCQMTMPAGSQFGLSAVLSTKETAIDPSKDNVAPIANIVLLAGSAVALFVGAVAIPFTLGGSAAVVALAWVGLAVGIAGLAGGGAVMIAENLLYPATLDKKFTSQHDYNVYVDGEMEAEVPSDASKSEKPRFKLQGVKPMALSWYDVTTGDHGVADGYNIPELATGGDWAKAPPLRALCAASRGGSRGAQVWGVNLSGEVHTTYQGTGGGGNWQEWDKFPTPKTEGKVDQLTASQQGSDQRVQLWALTDGGDLHSCWEMAPGGGWTDWTKAGWGGLTEKLMRICAASQGGSRGAQIWCTNLGYHQIRQACEQLPRFAGRKLAGLVWLEHPRRSSLVGYCGIAAGGW